MKTQNKNHSKILIDDLSSIGTSVMSSVFYGTLAMKVRQLDSSRTIVKIYTEFNRLYALRTNENNRYAGKSSYYLWLSAFLGAEVKGKNSVRGDDYNWLYTMLGESYIDESIKLILDSENIEAAFDNTIQVIKNSFVKCLENIILIIRNNNFDIYFDKLAALRAANI